MDAKCGMVYHIRDFPLPILDIQSEKESVQDIVHQRDVFGERVVILIYCCCTVCYCEPLTCPMSMLAIVHWQLIDGKT